MSSTQFTADRVLEWGKEAAAALIDRDVPLVQSIAQIAEAHALETVEKIARVCEAANHEVFRSLRGDSMEKLFAFDTAQAKDVVARLNSPPEEVAKVATGDYEEPPPSESLELTVDEVFDHLFPKQAKDIVAQRHLRQKQADLVAQRNSLTAAKSEFQARQVRLETDQQRAEDRLYQRVKEMILEGKTFQEAYDRVVSGDVTGSSMALMGQILKRLKQENLVDEAARLPDERGDFHAFDPENPVQKEAREVFNLQAKLACYEEAEHSCDVDIARIEAEYHALEAEKAA